MMNHETRSKKQVLVVEGIFQVSPPRLIGSKCRTCGEVFFPQRSICANCYTETTEQTTLSTIGKLYSYTRVTARPPGECKLAIPYAVGTVVLPDGLSITALLTESDTDKWRVGMDVELVIEKLFDDEEGNEIIGFKFKPTERS